MDEDLKVLYQSAMGSLMDRKAIEHRRFFSKEEFENNIAEIFNLTAARRRVETKLKNEQHGKIYR